MDQRKLESRLVDWSREFGFILPEPETHFFSKLVATPQRAHLWDMILNKLKSKEEVKKIRKAILAAELKANKDRGEMHRHLLNVNRRGIGKKIDLWNKVEMMQKKKSEKKEEIAELKKIIYKRAQSVQFEICKIAEIEKSIDELREKVVISKLLSQKHRNALEHYEKEIETIKSYGIFNSLQGTTCDKNIKDELKHLQNLVIEELGKGDFNFESEQKMYPQIGLLVTDKNVESKTLEMLIENKKENIKKYSVVDSIPSGKDVEECGEKMSDDVAVKSIREQFMLDITENSLHTCLNKTCENAEAVRFDEIMAKIKKILSKRNIFGSFRDISHIRPDDTGDSFESHNERLSKMVTALSLYGLKKRRECLKLEIEKLAKENEDNEFWTSEMEKFEKEVLSSSENLVSLRGELARMVKMHKVSAESVVKKYNELGSVINDVNYRFKERNIFERLLNLNREIRTGMETTIDLVEDMVLDAFRKVQISPGKEVYEFESLHHCLNHYGGELRQFFCTVLLSPYDKPESILTKLEERKSLHSSINEILEKEKDREMSTSYDVAAQDLNEEELAKNYELVERALSKILMRKDFLDKERDFIKKILTAWKLQTFRFMIPDDLKLNSMTLRQYESKFQGANTTCLF